MLQGCNWWCGAHNQIKHVRDPSPRWEASFYWTHVSIDEYKLLDAFSSFLIHSHQSWEYFSSSFFFRGMLRFHSDQVSDGWWPIKSWAVQHLLHLKTMYSTHFREVRRASNGMNCYVTGVQCFTSDTCPFYSLSFFRADNHRCHAPHRITAHKVVHNESVYRKRRMSVEISIDRIERIIRTILRLMRHSIHPKWQRCVVNGRTL